MSNGTNSNKPDEPDFGEFITTFAKGSANHALTNRLQEVVQACRETQGKGSLTLKLTVGCHGGMSEVKAKISYSKPDPTIPGAVFFTTEAGSLVEEDPRQLKLPAKVIDIQPVRTINNPNPTTNS